MSEVRSRSHMFLVFVGSAKGRGKTREQCLVPPLRLAVERVVGKSSHALLWMTTMSGWSATRWMY